MIILGHYMICMSIIIIRAIAIRNVLFCTSYIVIYNIIYKFEYLLIFADSCLYTFEDIYNSEEAEHCVREKTVNQPTFSDKRVKNWIWYHIYTGQYPNLEEYAAIMYKNLSDKIVSCIII